MQQNITTKKTFLWVTQVINDAPNSMICPKNDRKGQEAYQALGNLAKMVSDRDTAISIG
jgi:hypothetical protein